MLTDFFEETFAFAEAHTVDFPAYHKNRILVREAIFAALAFKSYLMDRFPYRAIYDWQAEHLADRGMAPDVVDALRIVLERMTRNFQDLHQRLRSLPDIPAGDSAMVVIIGLATIAHRYMDEPGHREELAHRGAADDLGLTLYLYQNGYQAAIPAEEAIQRICRYMV